MPNDLQRLALGAAAPADPGKVCFSDEIGIDFPSMGAAVSRVREGLLASAAVKPFEARISLSLVEALHGHEVVVSLPVRRTCPGCGGRGEVWNEACSACGGLGDALDHHVVQVAVPAGVRDGTRVRLTVSARQAPTTDVELLISVK